MDNSSLDADDIFRKEALDYKFQSSSEAPILLLPARPSSWLYRLLVLLLLICSVLLTTVRVSSNVPAPAVIRATSHDEVRASRIGIVERVYAHAGDAVKAGEPIIGLEARDIRSQLSLSDAALRGATASILLQAQDRASRETVMRLRGDNVTLQAALEYSILRSPRDGVLTDLRVRVGQSVSLGETLASISLGSAPFEVMAFVPGHLRPELANGQQMILALGTTDRVYKALVVSRIDDRAIGPSDVRRVLGQDIGDALTVFGSVFVVRAALTDNGDSSSIHYFDGMPATATIKASPKRALFVLFPSLSTLVGK